MEQTLQKQRRFTNQMLVSLLIPLVIEQILLATVGIADSTMVASSGEAAVSGVSIVDQMNNLLIQLFAALATGGAVVASQYLGRKDYISARSTAKQLLWFAGLLSFVIAVPTVLFRVQMIQFVFGALSPDVMAAAETYLWITALSFPFLALYNAGASVFRCMGNSKVSLAATIIMNIINTGGNAILIYGFGWGVAGAATATLVSRAVASVFVLVLLHNRGNKIYLEKLWNPQFSRGILKSVLRIGVPSGIENSMFHVGKLLVVSLIASFGTTAMAANAVCNNLASFTNVPGNAVSLAMIAVVGQCVGAKDYDDAKYYMKKMMMISYTGVCLLSIFTALTAPWIVSIYHLSAETSALALRVVYYNCVMTAVFWPMSFTMPNALRAAGDAKFTMVVSMVSMWLCRVLLSYVLGVMLGLGFFGVWVSMTLDWVLRGLLFALRARGGKWKNAKVI